MKTISPKTYSAKPGEIQRDWMIVDAEGQTLGRLATRIADELRGKNKPQYTPHVDTGNFVIVVNAEKIQVTGKKLDTKMVRWHTGYPGGLKERTLRQQLERRPTELVAPELDHVNVTLVQPVLMATGFWAEMSDAEGYLEKATELGPLTGSMGFVAPDAAVPAYDRFVADGPVLVSTL